MKLLNYVFLSSLLAMLFACGGGGGNPGTSTSGGNGSTPTTTTSDTNLSVVLQNASGTAVNSVPAAGDGILVVTLKAASATPLAGQVVQADSSALGGYVYFPEGTSATTDSNGVAKIKVRRTSLANYGTAVTSISYAGFKCSSLASLLSTCTQEYNASSSASLNVTVTAPSLTLVLVDGANVVTDVVSSSGFTTLRAVLRFDDGTPVAQKSIDITGDLNKVAFPEGSSQITDTSGVATIKLARNPTNTGGSGTLKASASISAIDNLGTAMTTVVTGSVDYSLGLAVGVAKLSLSNLDVGGATLAAYGTRQISVQASLGSAVPSSPVQVNFSSNCGQISPASVSTNAGGLATTSFTATDAAGTAVSTLGCGGKTVEISASAVGADSIRKSFSVDAAPAVNLGFVVPANPNSMRIYLANSGGATQTTVSFLLTNSRGEAIPSQDVRLRLKTINGGTPKATFGSPSNVGDVVLTTDSLGKVSVPVYSGMVPTSVSINAALLSNTSIQTDSSVVVIASGRPVQSRVSLVPAKHAIRGFNFDGETTTITMSLADRQGNPVPDGTAVNFVSEAGVMIPPTCVTGAVPGNSQCTVTIRTQNPRNSARKGYVSILAYAAGEEDFVDANFSNAYDAGETFTDLGTTYRDDFATKNIATGSLKLNLDGSTSSIKSWDGTMYVHQSGEFAVPRASETGGSTPVPNVGDGVWGAADVRGQVVIVFSTDDFNINSAQWISASDSQWSNAVVTTGLNVSIQDLNGRSVPTGSTIAVAVTDNSPKLPSDGAATSPTIGTCALVSQTHTAVPNSLEPLAFGVALKQCVTGDQVSITVTTPAGSKTVSFAVP